MNIGIVCYPTFGGSGVLATELGKALADKGHVVHFITYQQPVRLTGFSANIFFHEVRVPAYPLFDFPPYETALASTLVDVVRNNNIDLLHVHYAIPHASAAFMAKQILAEQGIHVPFITTLHGTDITLVGKDNGLAQAVNQKLNQLLPLGHFHAIQQVVPTGIKPLRRISVRIGGSHARENPRQNRIYL